LKTSVGAGSHHTLQLLFILLRLDYHLTTITNTTITLTPSYTLLILQGAKYAVFKMTEQTYIVILIIEEQLWMLELHNRVLNFLS